MIFIGESYAGKTSIMKRFSYDIFNEDYKYTVGLDFHEIEVLINNEKKKLLLYDTSGDEKFRCLIPQYFSDSQIIIIVYDISNKDSFKNVINLINMIDNKTKENAIITLVGNKKDLENIRQVSTKEAEAFARQKGFLFHEVSSKTGEKIKELFENMIFPEIIKKLLKKEGENDEESNVIQLNDEKTDKIVKNKEELKIKNSKKLKVFLEVIKSFGILKYNEDNLEKDYKILMLGLDASGKTVILYISI